MFQQFQGGEAAVMEMDPIDERLVAFEDDLGEDTDSSGEEVQVNKLTKMLLAFWRLPSTKRGNMNFNRLLSKGLVR